MSALGIAMLILGCSETSAPCVPLFVEKSAYASLDSCERQSTAVLESHLDMDWPVIMARCMPHNQLPAINHQAAASGLVEQAGDGAFVSNTADRLPDEGRNRQTADLLRRLN